MSLIYPIHELTRDQKDALVGTNGDPSDANKYVTSIDTRLTPVTGIKDGIMTQSDKTKLDNLPNIPTIRTLTAGAGMTGGGDLSADRTFDIVAANGTITVNAGSIQVGVLTATEHGNLGGGALHSIATVSVNGFMSAADKTKLNGIAAGATANVITNTAPVNVTKAAAAVGVSTELARQDHKHDVTTASPVAVGTANSAGSSTSLVRADHVHAHGAQTDGTLHAVATQSVNGFMSAADKIIVDGALTTAPGSGVITDSEQDSYRVQFDTTSTTFQLYRTFTTAALQEAIHRFGWTYQCVGSSTSTQIVIEVRLDDVPVDVIMLTPRSAGDRISQGGFIYKDFTGLGETTHTLKIYIKSGAAGKQATIFQSDMEVWLSNI